MVGRKSCTFRGVDYVIEPEPDGAWRWSCDDGVHGGFASEEAAASDARRVIHERVSRAHKDARAEPGRKTSFHVYGVRRDDTKTHVCMIVDSDYPEGDSPHTIAAKIAGPEYSFHASSNIFQAVPDHVKNRLFVSDEELYAAVPELNPRRRRSRARGIAPSTEGKVPSGLPDRMRAARPDEEKKTPQRRSYERSIDEPIAITQIEYGGVQEAYDYFNVALFDGELVDVFITYQRRSHSKGYFSADRFSGRQVALGKHELALNPDAFIDRTDEQIASTLVHEMVHVWQHTHGKPSDRGYHNREWATKMKSLGLQPSTTGAVGGKETGQQVTHYIIADGPFAKAFATFVAATGWRLNLQSAHRPGPKGGTDSKTKFTCSTCGQNAWGKPELEVTCTPCGIRMTSKAKVETVGSYERNAA
jgi:hypothetical protein